MIVEQLAQLCNGFFPNPQISNSDLSAAFPATFGRWNVSLFAKPMMMNREGVE
jgi:hypothetical protein